MQGDYVVLASEPVCICGCDVAAPQQVRRAAAQPLADFFRSFDRQFTSAEWAGIRGAGDEAAQEAQFRWVLYACGWQLQVPLLVPCTGTRAADGLSQVTARHSTLLVLHSLLPCTLHGCFSLLQAALEPERGVCEGNWGGAGLPSGRR
jgi:hypothetical protein